MVYTSKGEKVFVMWDACHMVKLVRNTFSDKRILFNPDKKPIQWELIEKLTAIQSSEGLTVATKVTQRHINYHNDKMKVKLAVQVLSTSVCHGLMYCTRKNIPGFEDTNATSQFCLIINDAFDMLNSRHRFSKSIYNHGISADNCMLFENKILFTIDYLSNLYDSTGQRLIETNRKTGFLGLVIDLTNLLNLYEEYVVKSKVLKYILSYKFSQDHLETFFGAIRRRGGWNNNPSAVQFKTAYKRLLVKHQITSSSSGNCGILDATSILHVGSGTTFTTRDTIIPEENVYSAFTSIAHDHAYVNGNIDNISPYVEDVLNYIAGFVVRSVSKRITCDFCRQHLATSETTSALINLKNRGGLIIPSPSVVFICKKLESIIRINKYNFSVKGNLCQKIFHQLMLNCLDFFNDQEMTNHIKQQDLIDNHKYQLIKLVAYNYINLRLRHEARKINQSSQTNVRQKYNRLVLFAHQ
ncbi:hypothetical protein ABEB36_010576 [Hypothenemus hampei]|uniref:THAP domain-containing protein 9 n=1 Tax=Hypothenemus hampei TaxID=57062 RepID=A0ABD1EPB5_HYPHA